MHGAIYKCWKKKLMKINLFLKFLFLIYILLFWKVSNAFEYSVAGKYKEIFSPNGNVLSKITSLIYLLDYVSIYKAIISNIDPTPVKEIDFIKKRLSEV